MKTLLILIVLLMAVGSPLFAGDIYPLMFHPSSVEAYTDMPEDLAKAYPNHTLIMVIFHPVNHPAAKDGSNLKDGEGSWLDRGMKPGEPDRIRFLVGDGELIQHTLKVSDGPFIFKVRNTGKGYFETVPLASPELQLVSINLQSKRSDMIASCVDWLHSWKSHVGNDFWLAAL